MFVYREKDNLLFKLHPYTMIFYIMTVFIGALFFEHPLFLAALFLSLAGVIVSADVYREWKGYLKFSLFFMLIIVLVNIIFVSEGETILYRGATYPFIGSFVITLEAFLYALNMGMRFLIIISAFCLFTYTVSPDKLLSVLGGLGNKLMLMITLSTRLYPLMVADVRRIVEVQKCRGVDFSEKGLFKKIKKYIPILNISLLSSLERSLNLAESMEIRGYGSGKRSVYEKDFYRPRDFIIGAFVLISILFSIIIFYLGRLNFVFYPLVSIENINLQTIFTASILMFFLLIPAFLNWGWKKFLLLRQKI